MGVRKSQTGFSVVEFVIVVLVVAVIGFAGFSVYNRQKDNKTDTAGTKASQTATASTESGNVPTAPQINNTSDLDKAAATLDQTNLNDTSDSTQLDNQTGAF